MHLLLDVMSADNIAAALPGEQTRSVLLQALFKLCVALVTVCNPPNGSEEAVVETVMRRRHLRLFVESSTHQIVMESYTGAWPPRLKSAVPRHVRRMSRTHKAMALWCDGDLYVLTVPRGRHTEFAELGLDSCMADKSEVLQDNVPTPDTCAGCGARSTSLRKCSSCKVAYYCSAGCQRGHWPQHKSACSKLAFMFNTLRM